MITDFSCISISVSRAPPSHSLCKNPAAPSWSDSMQSVELPLSALALRLSPIEGPERVPYFALAPFRPAARFGKKSAPCWIQNRLVSGRLS